MKCKLVAVMPVRNEGWVLGLTLRAALMWCDEVVILLHSSTDDSLQIVADVQSEVKGRIYYAVEPGEWEEMRHRQWLLEFARSRHATHIALMDSDEILTGNLLTTIRPFVTAIPKAHRLTIPQTYHRETLTRHHYNGLWANRAATLAFADDARLHYQVTEQFHHTEPFGLLGQTCLAQRGRMHLWGVTERRLRARHALYKVIERLRWPAKEVQAIEMMYNDWRSPADNVKHWPTQRDWGSAWTFAESPAEWWEPYTHLLKYVDLAAAPWQEAECRNLVAQHGAETFKGLNLFGLA